MKIYLSPSDQLSNPYAYGGTNEALQCRKIAAACKTALERNGFEVKTNFDRRLERHVRARARVQCLGRGRSRLHPHKRRRRPRLRRVRRVKKPRAHEIRAAGFDEIDAITPYRSVYGIREKQFYEIRNTTGTCIYCECEFHDSPDTARWIVEHTDDIGEAICRGICRAAGRNYIEKGSENDMTRWERLEDIPASYREMAQRFVDAGALRGKDGGKLDITEDMLRTMEIMRRYFEREA